MFKQLTIFKFGLISASLAFLFFVIFQITPAWGEDDLLDMEIQQLNNQIQSQKQQLDSLAEKQKAYSQAIAAKQAEKMTLSSQLGLLETRVAKAESEIESTNLEINKTDLEARKISLDILDTNSRVDSQKEHISKLLRLMYKQNQVSALEVLLLNDSISEFLNQAKYLENANDELKNTLVKLQSDKDKLERAQLNIKDKRKELADLKNEMENQKSELEYQKSAKNSLLEETKSSESAYQDLLAKAKKEAQQTESEISNLERTIRDKMAQSSKDRLSSSDSTISWPVVGHVITATFHDPDYPFRRIIGEHSAIDIRAKQGSPLYAAADGYVARVKFDGSSAYAYIMIIHDNGLSTVYGHVSGVNVEADQYVTKGQRIGSTGGGPGMPGSGPFSTGSHLHFEVRKNGIPVNPLNYLNN
ncbi:MAG: peptidoglycan DD-metalloendopeptidase family protein [Patescibacteria group bacterium]|nr:peptidoglycan DD-metalloendopeptidase family protein [Patescibacteria group bacterium]